MKKNILGLLVLGAALLLSSCVIVTPEKEHINYYDVTLVNDSDIMIVDWYLKKSNGENITKSENYEIIKPGNKSKIYNVREGVYSIYYSIEPNKYRESAQFYLDDDKTFYCRIEKVYLRSINSDEKNEVQKLCLTDQDGNKIELKSERIE